MTEVNPPFALQTGSILHPARLFRRALGGIVGEGVANYNPVGGRSLSNDLKVTQNSPTGMSVIVARGGAYVKGDDITDQGVYFVYNDADKVLTVTAAHATLARKDIVVARVKDTTEGQTGDAWSLEVIAGTAAGSPSEPTLPASAFKLATIDVAAASTSVTNANITDRRVVAAVYANALPAMVGAHVYKSTNQNLTDATATAVTMNNEFLDTLGMHDNSTNPSRLTIPSGYNGQWLFFAQVQFAADAAESRRFVYIRKNGAGGGFAPLVSLNTGTAVGYAMTIQAFAISGGVAGDYFEVVAQQNSGGTIAAVGNAAGDATWFAGIFQGANS